MKEKSQNLLSFLYQYLLKTQVAFKYSCKVKVSASFSNNEAETYITLNITYITRFYTVGD